MYINENTYKWKYMQMQIMPMDENTYKWKSN